MQIENVDTLEKKLDNDEITILGNYMKYSNCKIVFLQNCTSKIHKIITKNVCYQNTLNRNNYSKEYFTYDDMILNAAVMKSCY
uniref:Uncharacterized protein n=1 Tax=Strongyloides venezuelensis TaxID=75913 RepID=A0A0K0FHA2_STRVS